MESPLEIEILVAALGVYGGAITQPQELLHRTHRHTHTHRPTRPFT